ncbi:MAG: ATP-binding protein [Candidatus Aminicenantes bacterium]|nr:MAG: ATP-binding protein [Candidatus Aminicenantes bacterium]
MNQERDDGLRRRDFSEEGRSGNSGMKTLKLKSQLAELDRMRSFLRKYLKKLKISDKDYFKIELALLEICVNIIRYAYPQSNGDILIKAWHNEGKMFFEIRDSGVPFDPRKLKTPDIEESIRKEQTGGLGVFLSRSLMDGFDYKREDDQNILTIYKNMKETGVSL